MKKSGGAKKRSSKRRSMKKSGGVKKRQGGGDDDACYLIQSPDAGNITVKGTSRKDTLISTFAQKGYKIKQVNQIKCTPSITEVAAPY